MNENSTNPLYSRPYDISNQSSSFTNISIPTGFGCELWIMCVMNSNCSVDFVPFCRLFVTKEMSFPIDYQLWVLESILHTARV